ncbi:MAG: hypothetical protein NWE92_03670 [Candidatus Bathyarchaeota archaeon]|nr:hypothetical protein [Candidatus Bathyarchaeota archaeon]
MKAPIALLITTLILGSLLCTTPTTTAQTNIATYQLTFHNYSVLLRADNNSFCVYDGADGAAADASTAGQVTLDAMITGQRDGWAYYSASVVWVIRLPMDLHVVGTVNMRTYLSSTFKLSGLFSGSGYGMGLVDIDENDQEVQQFITEAPYTIGANALSSTPTQYSLSTNIDYTFKKGHAIGFAVGFGATTQGYSGTVYFGSPDKASGATLPVEDKALTSSLIVNTDTGAQTIGFVSDSATSGATYDASARRLQFTAQAISYTSGYCKVAVPKTLLQAPFTVTQGTQQITPTITENADSTEISFTHIRNTDPIQILGALPQTAATATPTATSGPQATTTPQVPEISTAAVAVFVVALSLAIFWKKKVPRQG